VRIIIKRSFKRDRDKVSNTDLLQELVSKLEQIERAKSHANITGLKPMIGYATMYRIYVKAGKQSYRIGAIIRGNTIWLVRFLSRKKIYGQFP